MLAQRAVHSLMHVQTSWPCHARLDVSAEKDKKKGFSAAALSEGETAGTGAVLYADKEATE